MISCTWLLIPVLVPCTPASVDTLHLAFTVQPSTSIAGAMISPAVQVTVQDSSGQTVGTFTGAVTVEISEGSGNDEAELSGTTTVVAVAGVATFATLSIDSTGSYTLTATADGLADVASAAFSVTARASSEAVGTDAPDPGGATSGAAAHAEFLVQPSPTTVEASITPAIQVAFRDAAGQTLTSFAADVKVEITDGTGDEDAELSGTTTVTALAGVATFTNLSIDKPGKYTLTATAAGLGAVVSAEFEIGEGEAAPAAAAATTTLRATTLNTELVLDGRLDEPAWSSADSIVNLVTIEPTEGAAPAGQTTVKVLVNPSELVFGVICYDSNPGGIVAFAKTRDFDLELEDHVLIVIDPFQDGRTGYVFAVNPNGARFDGLVSAYGEEVNTDWDGIWEAATSRNEQGWSIELRIPIKTLSFKVGSQGWGFNVERRVQRLLEVSRWAGTNRDYEIYQTSHAGLLTDLPTFDLGLGLSIRPGLVANANKPSPDADRVIETEGSLDATKKLGPNLIASLTVNTDFAETEVDARQTNLTRFDQLFPEKRTFFLEGADIFEFGLGNDEDLIAFHSRRIGLQGEAEDQVQIPITVGGKLNGRIGNTNVGALTVRTRGVDTLPTDATMGAVRVKQNVLSESSVGLIATFGDPEGIGGSWMGGADFTFQTSEFRGDKNLILGVWGLRNHRDDLGGASAFGGMIDYPNDLWDVSIRYKHIGEGFSPSLSFVPRNGIEVLQAEMAFKPRPSVPHVRQLFIEFNPVLIKNLQGGWESFDLPFKPLDIQLESGDRFEFNIEREGDRPSEDFELFSTDTSALIVPAGTYRWTRYAFQGALAAKRRFNGEATVSGGTFYGGHLNSVGLTVRMKPSAFLTTELGWERNSARLPGGAFIQRLYTGRVQVNVSADLQISSFAQYDNESRNLGTNTRLRWTFNPLGDLFVVFNHNLLRDLNDHFGFESNQLLVKLQYAYRL
ncbi:MAG TPA: DUF5916 domain-containing protein [Gemmatimonadales bacterium]|nr:DUF5916 domain-containing protein [Gemmatimonadales bacterium]